MSEPTPAAGWYPDPARSDLERYWDGAAWSSQTRTIEAAPADPAVPAETTVLAPQRGPGGRRALVASAVVATLTVVAGVGAFALLREDTDPPPLAVDADPAGDATDATDATEDADGGPGEPSTTATEEPSAPEPAPTESGALSELEDLPEANPTWDPEPTFDGGLQAVLDAGHIPTDRYVWDLDRTVQVIVATVPEGGESAHIFVDGERIGRDLLDPSHRIEVADVGPSSIVLRYTVFEQPGSDRCCPDAATTVEYVWDGASLTPIDDIPSSDPSDPWARN